MTSRQVRFTTVAEVIDDVQRLQRGHVQLGKWTLPQASWHLGGALASYLHEIPMDLTSTPEQIEMQKNRLEPLLASGKMPAGVPTPKGTDPLTETPAPLGPAEIDAFIAGLKNLECSSLKKVCFGFVGVITLEQFRQFILIHSANHLSHFVPT